MERRRTAGTVAHVIDEPQTAGELIRFWRTRRRLSQLELALDANLSTKHLSFVESGRSRPSRQLLVHDWRSRPFCPRTPRAPSAWRSWRHGTLTRVSPTSSPG
jgi:DNA-binding XRE family transcriptional regulator